jgi:hypothetical protein
MLALNWRCDGSDGIEWRLRGLDVDGAFYGEILCRARPRAATVSGQLSPPEAERMAELVAVIRRQRPPAAPGPHFAALFDRSQSTLADARRLFEYRLGDETQSEAARAFVELARLIERHLLPHYAKIAEPEPAH